MLTSGVLYFIGILLILASIGLGFMKNKISQKLHGVAFILGISAVVLSITPIPVWLYILFGIILGFYIVICGIPKYNENQKQKVIASAILIGTCLMLFAVEVL